jgi:xanthine dehydrogenase accessory factor
MHSLRTWKFILENLDAEIPVMLLYVLDSKGSSPGRPGFFMAVNKKDEMEGSIGGGMMEHKWVEVAKERLKLREINPGSQETSVKRQVHDKSAAQDQSGMICSGEQTILIYPVSQHDRSPIKALIDSLEHSGNGQLELKPAGLSFSEIMPDTDFSWEHNNEQDWVYREKTGPKNSLTIIGGGHCSLALSRLMREMDFYIRVYDNRPGLKTMTQNTAAHELHVLNDYSELTGKLMDQDQYVVIMTFGYRTDDEVMRALKEKPFRYIGLLGSSSKITTMMEQYRSEKFPEDWLKFIHAPIGLTIHSQTPEEIAVSIAAEIIKVKNSPSVK